MRRIGTYAAAIALAFGTGVAFGVPPKKDPLADLATAPGEDPPQAHRPLVAPPTSPFEVELAIKKYDDEEKRIVEELARLDEELAIVDERVVARGKAYFKQVRAGLLPAGAGFDELVDYAARVERTRLALVRDLESQKAARRKRDKLGDVLTRIKSERAPLDLQREAVAKAQSVMRQADERRAAFDRAFEGSSAPSDYVAIYGADLGPSDLASVSFAALHGKLPLPISGRTEVRKLEAKDTSPPALELRALGDATARAVAPGRVVFADDYEDLRFTVILDHGDRFFSVYGNLLRCECKVGESLRQNAPVGPVASRYGEGPVLYFELRKEGRAVDPAPWFGL